MHQPADVNGELLRLRAGQQHAVVERVQKSFFTQPAPPLDQLTVHDRDLTGRAAEGDEPQLDPEAKRLRERDVPPRKVEVTFVWLAGCAWLRDFWFASCHSLPLSTSLDSVRALHKGRQRSEWIARSASGRL